MCHNVVVMAVCAFHTYIVCLFLVVIIAISSPGSVLLVFFVSVCPFHKWNNFSMVFFNFNWVCHISLTLGTFCAEGQKLSGHSQLFFRC